MSEGGFGEHLVKGMKIGVLLEFVEDNGLVTFYQDGRCLGRSFVAKRLNPAAEIFPVVSAHANGDKFAIRFSSPPEQRERQPLPGTLPVEGAWVLQRLSVGPELHEFPLAEKMQGHPVSLQVRAAGPGAFFLSARVVNTINVRAESAPDSALAPFDGLKVHPGPATMMMGPPGAMEAEREISSGLQSVFKWLVRGDSLMLTGATCEFDLVRGAEEVKPVTHVDLP